MSVLQDQWKNISNKKYGLEILHLQTFLEENLESLVRRTIGPKSIFFFH